MAEDDYQNAFRWLITRDVDFVGRFAEMLRPEVYELAEERWLVKEAKDYYLQFHAPLPRAAVEAQLSLLPERQAKRINSVLVLDLYDNAQPPGGASFRDFMLKWTADFLRAQVLADGVVRAQDLLSDGKVIDAQDLLAKLGDDIVILGDTDLGYEVDDVEGFISRLREEYTGDKRGVRTKLPTVDAVLRGGLRAGELGVFIAPPGSGKSQALCYLARAAYEEGLTVAFYSLEMSPDRVMERLWAYPTDMDTATIHDNLDEFEEKVKLALKRRKKEGLGGKIYVKRYPAKAATADTIAAHIEAIHKETGQYPDLVVIDYADILAAPRKFDQRRDELAMIYEDLRALAVSMEVPVWTASQTNRVAFNKRRVNITHISDSWDKAKIADYIIAITKDQGGDDTVRFLDCIKVRNAAEPGLIRMAADFTRTHFEDLGLEAGPD